LVGVIIFSQKKGGRIIGPGTTFNLGLLGRRRVTLKELSLEAFGGIIKGV